MEELYIHTLNNENNCEVERTEKISDKKDAIREAIGADEMGTLNISSLTAQQIIDLKVLLGI